MQRLTRQDIADWIRQRARDSDKVTNDPGELLLNIYTGLRGRHCTRMAVNTVRLALLIGLDIVEEAVRTNETKGKDYAPGSDILANFYRVADVTGLDALSVWGVYVTKHVEAIKTFVQHGKLESEPIDTRLVDVLVYSALGYFIMEREGYGNCSQRQETPEPFGTVPDVRGMVDAGRVASE